MRNDKPFRFWDGEYTPNGLTLLPNGELNRLVTEANFSISQIDSWLERNPEESNVKRSKCGYRAALADFIQTISRILDSRIISFEDAFISVAKMRLGKEVYDSLCQEAIELLR